MNPDLSLTACTHLATTRHSALRDGLSCVDCGGRYLQECLPRAEYWDMPVAGQTETATAERLPQFLGRASASSSSANPVPR